MLYKDVWLNLEEKEKKRKEKVIGFVGRCDLCLTSLCHFLRVCELSTSRGLFSLGNVSDFSSQGRRDLQK
jgi:hypothetical protein